MNSTVRQGPTITIEYNSISSLERAIKRKRQLALLLGIMNSMIQTLVTLNKCETTKQNGIVLIFDEICTGIRLAEGGAQEYFKVVPDLSVFGKGIGNGYPISAVMGAERFMSLSSEVFYSETFGGEAISLAACKSVLEFVKNNAVVDNLRIKGERIVAGVNSIINDLDMGHILSLSGHPSWSFVNISGTKKFSQMVLKTYFLQESYGVLILGSHNVNFSIRMLISRNY